MSGIKVNIPKIIIPYNSGSLKLGICLDTHDAELVINFNKTKEEKPKINIVGLREEQTKRLLTIINKFYSLTGHPLDNLDIRFKNTDSIAAAENEDYLIFCSVFALNHFYKQILDREDFIDFCIEEKILNDYALCSLIGGILLFNKSDKGYIKIYSCDGVFVGVSDTGSNEFAKKYSCGDFLSCIVALERSDFELMKSITRQNFDFILVDSLLILFNEEAKHTFRLTENNLIQALPNELFYKINRIGIEIA